MDRESKQLIHEGWHETPFEDLPFVKSIKESCGIYVYDNLHKFNKEFLIDLRKKIGKELDNR